MLLKIMTKANRVAPVIAWTVACGYVLLLPACSLPDLRIAEPGPTLPDAFPVDFQRPNESGSSAQVSVEDFFKDPVLTGLIQEALAHNFKPRDDDHDS